MNRASLLVLSLIVSSSYCSVWAGEYSPEVARFLNEGDALLRQGKIGAARQDFEDALKANPNCPEAHDGIGRCFLRDGTLDRAATEFRAALKLDPLNVPSLNNLANVLYHQSKYDEAIVFYEQALKICHNNDPEILTNLANAQRSKGNNTEAIANYRLAIKNRPDFLDAYNNLALALYDEGKYPDALAAIRQALKIDGQCADAYYNLALIHRATGNFTAAREAANESLKYEKNPEFAESTKQLVDKLNQVEVAYGNLEKGTGHIRQGQWDKAEESLKAASPLPERQKTIALNNLGIALFRQHLFKDAAQTFERAIAAGHGNKAQANFNLGQARLYDGNKAGAKAAFQKAIAESNGKHALAHNLLGVMYKHENNLQAAIKEYETALAVGAPPVVHYNLGLALQQAGVYSEAIKHYEAYLKKAPHGLNAASARQEIQIIESQ
ncbi:MAG: tetratricopeptide repeat protein [Candidatus Obscuribacterales bacterium]|nr:tetratricopeptide repeat protein [Candidatus Obscuribacterales bacterium]